MEIARRHTEVARLVQSQFSRRCAAIGADLDDVVQDVLRRLVLRERRGTGWQPGRGAFSTYVVMVARSVVSHAEQRHRRATRRGEIGRAADVALTAIGTDERDGLAAAIDARREHARSQRRPARRLGSSSLTHHRRLLALGHLDRMGPLACSELARLVGVHPSTQWADLDWMWKLGAVRPAGYAGRRPLWAAASAPRGKVSVMHRPALVTVSFRCSPAVLAALDALEGDTRTAKLIGLVGRADAERRASRLIVSRVAPVSALETECSVISRAP